MTYDYKITYDFDYENQEYVWRVLPFLELMAKFNLGVYEVEYYTNHVGDTILTVHYKYHRRTRVLQHN